MANSVVEGPNIDQYWVNVTRLCGWKRWRTTGKKHEEMWKGGAGEEALAAVVVRSTLVLLLPSQSEDQESYAGLRLNRRFKADVGSNANHRHRFSPKERRVDRCLTVTACLCGWCWLLLSLLLLELLAQKICGESCIRLGLVASLRPSASVVVVLFAEATAVHPKLQCTQGLKHFLDGAMSSPKIMNDVKDSLGVDDIYYQPALYCSSHPLPASFYQSRFRPSGKLKDLLMERDVLGEIVNKGVIRVGSLKANWLHAGNYVVDPPTGFWPQYTAAVVKRMEVSLQSVGLLEPSKRIRLQYVLYPNSGKALQALSDGDIHMLDSFFLTNGVWNKPDHPDQDSRPLFFFFDRVCPAAISNNKLVFNSDFYQRLVAFNSAQKHNKNGARVPCDIVMDLQRFLATASAHVSKTILFLSEANKKFYEPLLDSANSHVRAEVEPDKEALYVKLRDGVACAAILSSAVPLADQTKFKLKEMFTDYFTVHAPWIRKTRTWDCVAMEETLLSGKTPIKNGASSSRKSLRVVVGAVVSTGMIMSLALLL